jgi:hypothetical protein
MLEGTDPPADFAVWRSAEACLLRLWHGVVPRAAGIRPRRQPGLGFMSREIGIGGLDITMV